MSTGTADSRSKVAQYHFGFTVIEETEELTGSNTITAVQK
jgi:hypothetical protein